MTLAQANSELDGTDVCGHPVVHLSPFVDSHVLTHDPEVGGFPTSVEVRVCDGHVYVDGQPITLRQEGEMREGHALSVEEVRRRTLTTSVHPGVVSYLIREGKIGTLFHGHTPLAREDGLPTILLSTPLILKDESGWAIPCWRFVRGGWESSDIWHREMVGKNCHTIEFGTSRH